MWPNIYELHQQYLGNHGALSQGKLVAGPWGDLSEDFHALLRVFADSRVAAGARARGSTGAE